MNQFSNDPRLCEGRAIAGVCSYRITPSRGRRCEWCDAPDALTAFREAQQVAATEQPTDAEIDALIASLEVMLRERHESHQERRSA